jgi:hypothetical protein
MAKKPATVATTVETLKPYLERALRDEDFRADLKDALSAARELYGPIAKSGSVKDSARALATDKKTQEQLRRAFEDLASAADTLSDKGGKKRKGKKGRKALLLAGIVAGALYNPWTGPQTREKLLDMIAGSDDLQPLEDMIAENGGSAAADTQTEAEEAADET